MPKSSWFTHWPIRLGIIILAAGLAYAVGIRVGDAANERTLRLEFEADLLQTDSILEKLNSPLKRGATLPLESLFDLDGHPFDPNSLSGGGLLLVYVDPGCGRCEKQAEFTAKHLKTHPEDSSRIAFVSFGLAELGEWKKRSALTCRFYHDANALIGRNYNITDFPTNIYVDSGLRVTRISLKPIVQEQVMELILRI